MLSKIKKYLTDKKGMSTIEFVICFMVFIMLFSYIFDLFLITFRQYKIAEQTTLITRQIAKQSGCEQNTPYNFPGGDGNYYTQLELYRSMSKKMNDLKVPDSDWKIVVKSKNDSGGTKQVTLTNSYSNKGIRTNYRDYITVEVTYNYQWGLWSQFIPGVAKGRTVVTRSAFSEYNHDLSK